MIKEYSSCPQKYVDNFTYKLTDEEFDTNPYLKLITYEQNDQILGFLLYSLIYERIEIEQFEVLKDYRNNGIGSIIMNYLIEKYKNKNILNITLEVKKDNTFAIGLYKKYCFREISSRKNYYNGIDGILMERKMH